MITNRYGGVKPGEHDETDSGDSPKVHHMSQNTLKWKKTGNK